MRTRVKPSIYQVFPRNYSNEGTLREVINDLPRIQFMGFDYLYLLPIHPIGVDGRKGKLGCPYSIRDYYAIAEELGNDNDFDDLLNEAHKLGLKVMIDIILNHSARDHVWTKTNPEYYIRDKEGRVTSKVPEWSDIADFDYSAKGLKEEVVKMLCYWADRGVDGFRCDVASAVPIDIWVEARKRIAKKHPGFIWLAESTHYEFIRNMRVNGHYATTDPDIYQAFDIAYNYDIIHYFEDAFRKKHLKALTKVLDFREAEYPLYASKLYHLENHDQPRIAEVCDDKDAEMNWLAFSFLCDGAAFVYAGQEAWCKHMPSLFDKDLVDWSGLDKEYEEKIAFYNRLRRETLKTVHATVYPESKKVLSFVQYLDEDEVLYGVFDVLQKDKKLPVILSDGAYEDLISGKIVSVKNGELKSKLCPCLLRARRYDLRVKY